MILEHGQKVHKLFATVQHKWPLIQFLIHLYSHLTPREIVNTIYIPTDILLLWNPRTWLNSLWSIIVFSNLHFQTFSISSHYSVKKLLNHTVGSSQSQQGTNFLVVFHHYDKIQEQNSMSVARLIFAHSSEVSVHSDGEDRRLGRTKQNNSHHGSNKQRENACSISFLFFFLLFLFHPGPQPMRCYDLLLWWTSLLSSCSLVVLSQLY